MTLSQVTSERCKALNSNACVVAYSLLEMRLPLRLSSDKDSSVVEALNRVAQRLDRLIELAERTNELLRLRAPATRAATEAQPPTGATDAVTTRASARRRRRRQSETPRKRRATPRSATAPRKPGLHLAIETVLREARGPLTAAEIAQRINERGLFVPPRSGKPLSSSQVNSRIANAHYRHRFRRENGRVALSGG